MYLLMSKIWELRYNCDVGREQQNGICEVNMKEYTYVTLRQKPELKEKAATWFHDKWEVPQEAYLECMEAYLNHETEYG